MGTLMDDEIKRWTARRKSALVLEIIQGKTTVAEASRAHDLPPSARDVIPANLETGQDGAVGRVELIQTRRMPRAGGA